MLNAEKVVFIELHKTGAMRVQKLLAEVAGAESPSKPAAFANQLAALGKPVVGYVCDPLIWYLRLWKHGCEGKGELYKRLTNPVKWTALHAKNAARQKDDGKPATRMAIPEGWDADYAKATWYADAESPAAFRGWLEAVLMTRGIRRLVSQGYNSSPVQRLAGLMTYEYFASFVRDAETMEKSVATLGALEALNEQQAITRHFVRAESAGSDLLAVADALGLPMTEAQREAAKALDKDKTPVREKLLATFYDKQSREWVRHREKFIDRLFGYAVSPEVGAPDATEAEADSPAHENAAAAPDDTMLAPDAAVAEVASESASADPASPDVAVAQPVAGSEVAAAPDKRPAKGAARKSAGKSTKPAAKDGAAADGKALPAKKKAAAKKSAGKKAAAES